MGTAPHISPKQAQWFASVRKTLESDTGKTLDEWVIIARNCPETKHKSRLNWFKQTHGLGVNLASTVLSAAFETGLGWDQPDALLNHLWKPANSRAIYDAIEACAVSLGNDVIVGPRKTFSGFSRKFQFAAARPTKTGVRLGFAIPLEHVTDCEAPKSSDSWSGRLKAIKILRTAEDVDKHITSLLRQAYEAS